jgi:16S rRNA processing protein RimM
VSAAPDDLVELGAVRGAYGTKGWVRIAPFDAAGVVLQSSRRWWLKRSGQWEPITVSSLRRHGALLLAKWEGCETPEAAQALQGATVAVARSAFPPAAAGEYYWVDLIGARVVNRADVELGKVTGLRNYGAQDLLEVSGAVGTLLVPLVEGYVEAIDTVHKLIRVDWEADW